MTALSKIVYYLANPLLMPLYTLLFIFQIESGIINTVYPKLRLFLYAFSFVICTIFPLISIAGLKFTKAISSIHIEKREERIAPYILTILYFCLAYYMLRFKFGMSFILPLPIYSSLLGAITAICLVAIINLKTKISAHCAGVSGLLGALIATVNKYFVVNYLEVSLLIGGLMILVGVTATSRLWLNAHTEKQVYAGLVLGFVIEYFFVRLDIII